MRNMDTIDHFNLRSFDMNLLVAFDALMEECSVTRAAARLRIQQPAMSHTLATLRVLLDDALFVRVNQRLQPTARALAVWGPVRQALLQAQDALRRSDGFDPAVAERTFRIALTNGMEALLLPELAMRFRTEAQGVRLLARSVDPLAAPEMLDRGEIDLAVGCYGDAQPWLRRSLLFEETMTCCFNRRHLRLRVPIDRKSYVETPHVVVSMRDALFGCMEDALREARSALNVVAAGPNFLAVLVMAAEGPVLTTLPTRIAEQYAPRFGLATSPVPLPLRPNPISLVWHVRAGGDPGNAWLRDQVAGSHFARGTAEAAARRA